MGSAEWKEYEKQRKRWEALRVRESCREAATAGGGGGGGNALPGDPRLGRVIDPLSVLQMNTNTNLQMNSTDRYGSKRTGFERLREGNRYDTGGTGSREQKTKHRAAGGVVCAVHGASRAAGEATSRVSSHCRRMVPALLPALSLVVRSLLPQSRPAGDIFVRLHLITIIHGLSFDSHN
jgi:hypothetical protein